MIISRPYLLGVLLVISQVSFALELPKSMAAMGDSITAAALASMNRDDGANNLLLPKFLWTITKYGYEKSIAAFEDRQLSWATGWDKHISSHAEKINKLKDAGSEDIKFINAAVSGDNSNGLAAQVQNVLKWSDATLAGQGPDYVVIDIGSDDLCQDTLDHMTSTDQYLQNVENALTTLLEKNNQSHILIGSMPNLEHLRDTAQNSSLVGFPFIQTCQDMWNTHHFCTDMLEESDPTKRDQVMARLNEYMDGLEKLTATLNAKWGDDHVRFSRDVYNAEFTDMDISVDCFHPNLQGQQIFSDAMWTQSWWN